MGTVQANAHGVRIEPWGTDGLGLLERLLGDPSTMRHLGGPEPPEKIAERQRSYEQPGSRQFAILVEAVSGPVGWVGYWERDWRETHVFEIGWSLLPAFHGRGIATAATHQTIKRAAEERARRYIHAFPNVDNGPSNAVCRKTGFVLIGEVDVEYPAGNFMRCNDWQVDLHIRGRVSHVNGVQASPPGSRAQSSS